jgi:hypothetical protein
MQYDFLHFLSRCKPGCRLLTYNNLEMMYEDVCQAIDSQHIGGERKAATERLVKPNFPWQRLEINTWE